MTLVSGPLSTVTADPTAVSVVQVSVQGPRTVGTGVQTHESKNVAVSGGVFSHEIAPGAATLTMIVGQQPGPPIPILVDDVASQTLAEVVDAARLATGETQESLAQLVQQALTARTEVLGIVDDLLEEKGVALSAISDARGGALTDIGQAASSAITDIGVTESGALSAIGVEVGKAEDAAVRAENAVNDGLGDGAVTLQKLAPDVTSQINGKADLVGGKVPTSQIPEVALTKPFSVASRAALLALDVQEGDIGIITAGADKGTYILGSGPSDVFSSWVQLAVSADAPVQSVNGQTGTVVLNATDVGASPTGHTHTVAQITDLPTVTQSNVADAIVQRQTNGNIQVPSSPAVGTDASSKAYVDQKILETGVVVEWADARKVTITAGTTSAFTQGSETGSTSLISYWTSGTPARAVFSVNVVCDKPTLNSSGSIVPAGSVIPAGIGFSPTSSGGIGPYTFTELGTTLGTLLENYATDDQLANLAVEVRWNRPPLTTTSNLDTLTDGLYPVPTTTVAAALGLPIAQPGELVTTWLDTSGIRRRQTFYADPITGADAGLNIFRRWYYNGTWQPWQVAVKPTAPYYRGAVPAGVTPEDMTGTTYQGLWTYDSSQAAVWSIPSQAAGMIQVSSSGASTLHQVITLTTPIQNYQRRWYNGTWSGDWETLGGGTTPAPEPVEADEYTEATSKNALNILVPSAVDPTLTYATDHAALVADLKTRIGTVTTGGKAAVALVADHGTTAFKEWLWAAAKARGIPFTMALAPEAHLDGKGDSRHLATNAEIKQWISEGLVIASHSGDHDGATGYFDVARQIVTSKKKLEEKLETTVDCWVQPGYALELGNYDGFGTGQSAERYTDFYAGRLLQQTYPVVTGYAGNDFVYPGNADLPVGVRRSLTERKDAYQGVLDYIDQAIATGGKHINFCHPYAIPDSSDTYVTKSEYIAYLDWLVTKRDAGDLVLLTLPELIVARP